MNKEIWKDICGFEKLYQISNYGRVKSLSKFINNNANYSSIGYYSKEKVLKPFKNLKGYQLIRLYKNKQNHTKKIHRLVAEARKTLHISNISSVCNGKRNKAGGYIWRYKND